MLEHRFNRLFPNTNAQSGDLVVEVVQFDVDDRPVKRHFLSMDYLLAPLQPSQRGGKGVQS